MSIAEVKKEIASLSAVDQEELATYLTTLRLNRDEKFRQELRDRKADQSPGNWVSLDDANRLLADDQ